METLEFAEQVAAALRALSPLVDAKTYTEDDKVYVHAEWYTGVSTTWEITEKQATTEWRPDFRVDKVVAGYIYKQLLAAVASV